MNRSLSHFLAEDGRFNFYLVSLLNANSGDRGRGIETLAASCFNCWGETSYFRHYLTLWGDKIQLRLKEKCKQGHMNKRTRRPLVNN